MISTAPRRDYCGKLISCDFPVAVTIQKRGHQRLSENAGRPCPIWPSEAAAEQFPRVLENWKLGVVAPIRASRAAGSQPTGRDRRSDGYLAPQHEFELSTRYLTAAPVGHDSRLKRGVCYFVPKEGRMVVHGNEIRKPSASGGIGISIRRLAGLLVGWME